MDAILMLNKNKKNNDKTNLSFNNGDIIGNRNNESLKKLLFSSSFSSNDAHSLPRELQQVNKKYENICITFLYAPLFYH